MNLKIYCDGGSRGNPGLSAFAYVILDDNDKVLREFTASCNHSTNNRMEIMAAISAMKYIINSELSKEAQDITIYSDSNYLVNTLTKNWKRNANTDLWKLTDQYISDLGIVNFRKVPGHSNCTWNNYVDGLLNKEMNSRNNTFTDPAYK